MIGIRIKGKKWDSRNLTPEQRVYSLAEKNYRETGDRETDKTTKGNIESVLKQAKNEQG